MPCSTRIVSSLLLTLSLAASATACATGADDDPLGPLSGAYSAGSGGYEEDTEAAEGSGNVPPPPSTSGGSGPPPPSDGSTSGADMGGNPLCCEAHPSAGCDSATTEMCVCTSEPSCCQAVWSVTCVDLAIQCGDPFCDAPVDPTNDPPPDDGGDPPPGDSGDPPPPPPPPEQTCPCMAGVDNFCSYGPSYPDCPMTAPGGYCDPNGDGSFKDGDWDQGWYDYDAQCT